MLWFALRFLFRLAPSLASLATVVFPDYSTPERGRPLTSVYVTAREAAERYGYTADHWRYLAREYLIERRTGGGVWLLIAWAVVLCGHRLNTLLDGLHQLPVQS